MLINETKLSPEVQAKLNQQVAEDWKQATISNGIIFNQVMSDKRLLLPTLQRILPHLNISEVELTDPEHSLQHGVENRGFRLDVFATDDQRRQFDIEMQVVNNHNLLKRSIAYLGTMVEDQLEKREPYTQLRPVHIIFLTMFDPLGKNRQYDRLELFSVFDGTPPSEQPMLSFTFLDVTNDQEETPPELRRLCQFINSGKVDPNDPLILKLKQKEHFAKLSSEWRESFMRIDLDQRLNEWEKQQAVAAASKENLAKGQAQGRDGAISEAVKYLNNQGNDEHSIIATLKSMFGLSTQQAEDYYHSAVAPA